MFYFGITSYNTSDNQTNTNENMEDAEKVTTSTEEEVTIKAGWLMKQGGFIRSWKKRWFKLNNHGILEYYNTEEDTIPIGKLDLNEVKSMKQLPTKEGETTGSFEIELPHRTYYLMTEKWEEVTDWFQAIQLIQEYDIHNKQDLSAITAQKDRESQPSVAQIFQQSKKNDPSQSETSSSPNYSTSPLTITSNINFTIERYVENETLQKRNMQLKTFQRWINFQLLKIGSMRSVKDMSKDLTNGSILVELVLGLHKRYHGDVTTTENSENSEDNSEKSASQPYHLNPTSSMQSLHNLNYVVKFLRDFYEKKSRTYPFPSIPVPMILNGNLKVILDLVWTIVFLYGIDNKYYKQWNGPVAIMHWFEDRVCLSENHVTNNATLSDAFQDGVSLYQLLCSYVSPESQKQITAYKKRENLIMVLDLGYSQWNIPRLFDVEDLLISEADEYVCISYLATCYESICS